MKVLRTANAGVLLEFDGIRLLLDGVSQRVDPYPETPESLRQTLLELPMDGLLYTHTHEDHYDPEFLLQYSKHFAGPILGPAEIPCSILNQVKIGDVMVSAVQTRHIGKQSCEFHYSYVLEGSRCVWFMGDATPLQTLSQLPKPDVLIVSYGFVIGKGWQICRSLQPKAVVILHLPERQRDVYGLWNAIEQSIADSQWTELRIPEIGEQFEILGDKS